jgi:hypothetical protein
MDTIYAYVETFVRPQFAGNAYLQRAKKYKSMRFVSLFLVCETRTTKGSLALQNVHHFGAGSNTYISKTMV